MCGHATLASAYTYFNFLNVGENEIVFQANRSEIKAVNTNKGITLSLPKDEPKKVENILPDGIKGIKQEIIYIMHDSW